jgi:PAS domain-containing protein
MLREVLDATAHLEALWNAPVGLALFDENLRCTRVNLALADLNGIPASHHLGKTVSEVLPHGALGPGQGRGLLRGRGPWSQGRALCGNRR